MFIPLAPQTTALATSPVVSRHQILNLTGSTGFLYQLEVEN
jgi:hypothetical protein